MKKSKGKLALAVICILVLVMNVLVFTACDEKNTDGSGSQSVATYNVTFMVPKTEGEGWKQLGQPVSSKSDGSVDLPITPEMQGKDFGGWFVDEACTTPFDDKKVTKDITVYGLYSAVKVEVVIKTNSGDVNFKKQSVADLADKKVEYTQKAKDANLVFTGWYAADDYKVLWTPESNSRKVYARYMAEITFDNGYEVVAKQLIVPGEKATKPVAADIVEDFNYMDVEDMYFVDENQEDYKFDTATFNTNTVIKVLWKTPWIGIGNNGKPIEGTNDYVTTGIDLQKSDRTLLNSFKVISIPSRMKINGQDCRITVLNGSTICEAVGAKKVIINEGIKYINGLTDYMGKNSIEEVVLPESLEIIESSFLNYKKLNKVVLPSNLQVIIDSFWGEYNFMNQIKEKGYDFEITVPESVNNISRVPANLKYANSELFFNENNMVFKNDSELGKVLVSAFQSNVVDGALTIPEGVDAIQVGAFDGLKYDFLNIPSTFKAVSYNNEKANYNYYNGNKLTKLSAVMDPANNPTTDKEMSAVAYSIVSDLSSHKYVKFNTSEYPVNLNKYAFNDRGVAYDELEKDIVVFVGDIQEGPVNIVVNATNAITEKTITLYLTKNAGETLTEEEVGNAIWAELQVEPDVFKISSSKQFGNEFTYGALNQNVYLDIVYTEEAKGVKYETVGEEIYVTGFDITTAKDLALDSESDHRYLVIIPDFIDDKPVTKIVDGAFEYVEGNQDKANNNLIAQVVIPASVKEIGANAFRNAYRLESVKIAAGGLQKIGTKAFEFAGTDPDDFTKANELLQNNELAIELPLANLGKGLDTNINAIGAYAFNSAAIRKFTPVKGEETRKFTSAMATNNKIENYEAYEYYFGALGFNSDIICIVRMLDKTPTKVGENPKFNNSPIYQYEYQYVATAAGTNATTSLTFGFDDQSPYGDAITSLYSAIILEGSVQLYGDKISSLGFARVSKVEKNAITYLPETFITPNASGFIKFQVYANNDKQNVAHMAKTELVKGALAYDEATQNVFEDGWFMGQANIENKFITEVSINESAQSTIGF